MRWSVVLAAALFWGGAAQAETVVCAPGGLAPAMSEVVAAAGQQGQAVKLVVGHSPAQARQIVDGAPCDLFISADQQWIDLLRSKNLLDGADLPLASTHLVLVAPAGSPMVYHASSGESLAAQIGDGKLGLADPDSVPAGRFARAALEKLGAWDGVKDRLARLPDVRTVAAMVERGEVAAGIGFASDLKSATGLRVVADFPAEVAPPVVFPMAVVTGHRRAEVEVVATFMRSGEAASILKSHGFAPPPDDRK